MFKKLKKGFNLGYKVGEHEVKINYLEEVFDILNEKTELLMESNRLALEAFEKQQETNRLLNERIERLEQA